MKYGILAAVAVSVFVSGCQRKAEGQTVAVVNGEEITAPDLNFALQLAKVPQGGDQAKIRNQALEQLVDRRLLVEQARKEDIDKSPEYLNRERRGKEDLLISMLADRRLNTAQLPSDREIQNFITTHPGMFANREMWQLDQVQFETPKDAALRTQLDKAKSLDELASMLQSRNLKFVRQKNQLDTATIPQEIYAKLVTIPSGKPFIIAAGSRSVANLVAAREPRPLSGDQGKPIAVQTIRKTQTTKSLEGLLKSLRSSAKIEYQAGYGPPAGAKK